MSFYLRGPWLSYLVHGGSSRIFIIFIGSYVAVGAVLQALFLIHGFYISGVSSVVVMSLRVFLQASLL